MGIRTAWSWTQRWRRSQFNLRWKSMLFHIPILNTSTSWVPLNLAPHTCSPPNDASIFFQRRPLISLLRHHRLHDELHAHTWTECSVLLEQENPAPPALLHQMRAAFLLTRVLPLSSPTAASLSHLIAGKFCSLQR